MACRQLHYQGSTCRPSRDCRRPCRCCCTRARSECYLRRCCAVVAMEKIIESELRRCKQMLQALQGKGTAPGLAELAEELADAAAARYSWRKKKAARAHSWYLYKTSTKLKALIEPDNGTGCFAVVMYPRRRTQEIVLTTADLMKDRAALIEELLARLETANYDKTPPPWIFKLGDSVVAEAVGRFDLKVQESMYNGSSSGFWLFPRGNDKRQYEVTPNNDSGEFVVRCNADESELTISHAEMREDEREAILARVLQFISDRLRLKRKEEEENTQRGKTTTVYIDPDTGRPINRDKDYWRDEI